jgi:outer membrane protein
MVSLRQACVALLFAALSTALPNRGEAQQIFTMSLAVERALQVNFAVSSARAGHAAAESFRKSTRSAFGPVLGTSYGYLNRQHKPMESLQYKDDDLYTWTVWLRQNVFAGFMTLNSYQKAVLQKENADANIDTARLDLVAAVQENFLLLLQARENVRSAKDSLARLRNQLGVTQAFHTVGLSPRLDVLQTEVDVATAEDSLLQATNNYETQVDRLNTLLNIPVEEPVVYTGDLEFVPFLWTFDQCLNTAYSKRPDLRMAAKAVAVAAKDVSLAESPLYPQVYAEGTWSTHGDRFDASGSTISPRSFSSWTIGITGEWTAFEWGKTYYEIQQQKHIETKMRAEENLLRQEIAFDIRAKLLKIDEAAKRIKVAQKGLEQAKEAYRLAGARYQAHVGTFLDVLEGQSKLTMAEAALTGAQADYMISLTKIYTAMGEEHSTMPLP